MEILYEGKQANKESGIEKTTQSESIMIPKHRFDCVNLCLKETKQALREKIERAESDKVQIVKLEKALLDAKIETALAMHRAKNLIAVKALIDFSNLKLEQDGSVPKLDEQILQIKKSQNYLFESSENLAYVLVPVKSGDSLNKSITNHINKLEREK